MLKIFLRSNSFFLKMLPDIHLPLMHLRGSRRRLVDEPSGLVCVQLVHGGRRVCMRVRIGHRIAAQVSGRPLTLVTAPVAALGGGPVAPVFN